MKTSVMIAALLAGLGAPAVPRDAQAQSEPEAGAASGPITRRAPPPGLGVPPEGSPGADPSAGDDTAGPAGGDGERPVLEVLDASIFDGVFAAYTVLDGREIPEPLTGAPGDPVAGRRLFHNFSRTGCSLCHGTAEAPRRADSDRTAPSLYRAAERLTPARIRLWIVAPETIRPGTSMPAFHKPGQRTDPRDPLYGGPRLTAAEVEDVVAYLARAGMPEGEE